MALSKLVLADVKNAFARHLGVSATPLQQDVTGIGHQLSLWEDRTVRDAANTLLQWSRGSGLDPLFIWSPLATGASAPDANGALVAVNTLVNADWWADRSRAPFEYTELEDISAYGEFDPID
ncbi:hypothetical protein HC251_04205 [Iamia sp. SCSIO 61187]|uniref:hypothetical protein n=1 Tax=Iamia sp. SCSIO 61187 TaxID=2722752 RepID=UPI001C63828D|nr:hypothetical protein [Iamia sp. SCSIO 61187]QYG91717.1 hypothetical protein HC251_04205 [Iamia sp. SCSIO 61187]